MRLKQLLSLAATTALVLALSGCGGNGGVRVTEGSEQIGAAPTGSLYITDQATIVHVDEIERLATLRRARDYAAHTFLTTTDGEGKQTATLKTRENRVIGLRTADILEGLPQINDAATPVSAAESARLRKIYRDPIEE